MKSDSFKQAFRYSTPVLGAYLFLGITYGLLAREMNYSIWIPVVMATVIYSGSVEFIALTLLLSTFHPLSAFVMAFIVGARHIFYGITMLDRYRGAGWRKPFLIYWMSDETFAVNYAHGSEYSCKQTPFNCYLWVSVLDFFYWVTGAVLGFCLGDTLGNKFLYRLEGLDFVVTAMFVAIFMDDYLRHKKTHVSSWLGIFCAAVCLITFGSSQFTIPTMVLLLAIFYISYKIRSKRCQQKNN